MVKNERRLRCTPAAVFEVLGDGWLYPSWVVGASRMRDVDQSWPKPGSLLRHSVGVWPLLINDSTSVIEWEPPHRMVLRARGWPIGEAKVVLTVDPLENGCLVRIFETAVRGPATLLPSVIERLLLGWRNRETLLRLAYLAEGREKLMRTTAELEREHSE